MVKVLLVTEKNNPSSNQRDGGARVVETLKERLGSVLNVMQFGSGDTVGATWYYDYPHKHSNRFKRRILNADFIAQRVNEVEEGFTHIIFSHISMQFGQHKYPLDEEIEIWTFPMFLTPSYQASDEVVPLEYLEMERLALKEARNILTPSYFEKQQLMEVYGVFEDSIHVVPRGINTRLLAPKPRFYEGALCLCSVGTIKPQKDTLGIIRLFKKLKMRFPEASLELIGPVQNATYFVAVQKEIKRLNLQGSVKFVGPVSPNQLAAAIEKAHLHISTAKCETFGRSIFETLASGLPNIARKEGNAAAEFLEGLPYIQFIEKEDQAVECIEQILSNYENLSSMAVEIGELFNDDLLSRLMVAEIFQKETLGISDFDGTLFHKGDLERTHSCIEAFKKFSKKIVCSARGVDDILEQISSLGLEVDWVIGYSGGVVADGQGKTCWHAPLKTAQVSSIKKALPHARPLEYKGDVLQMVAEAKSFSQTLDLRTEIYKGEMFISHWEASKFRAVHRLLKTICWSGRVQVYGDGPYDSELIRYFDGVFVKKENAFG